MLRRAAFLLSCLLVCLGAFSQANDKLTPDENAVLKHSPGVVLVIVSYTVAVQIPDGLHGVVSTEEIGQAAQTQSPYDACRTLVAMAKERGGLDNITVQILRLQAG